MRWPQHHFFFLGPIFVRWSKDLASELELVADMSFCFVGPPLVWKNAVITWHPETELVDDEGCRSVDELKWERRSVADDRLAKKVTHGRTDTFELPLATVTTPIKLHTCVCTHMLWSPGLNSIYVSELWSWNENLRSAVSSSQHYLCTGKSSHNHWALSTIKIVHTYTVSTTCKSVVWEL